MEHSQSLSSHSSKSSDTFELEQGENVSDYQIVRKINSSRYVTYLVHSPTQEKSYLMKLFRCSNDKPSLLFLKEARLANLSHPNLLQIRKIKHNEERTTDSHRMSFSYVLLDVPVHGEFFSLLSRHNFPKDEVLIRTYFHQLIEGLKYLHENGVAHMDLKLENLVLDENYNLRIANLNCSIVGDDLIVVSNGSDNYRAPEVKKGLLKYPMQADIYAAGIILYILAYQHFPYILEGSRETMDSFWDSLCSVKTKQEQGLAELIKAMVRYDPEDRISLEAIQGSSWYQNKIYTPKELKSVMENYFQTVVRKERK